jgi:hypothetical protein
MLQAEVYTLPGQGGQQLQPDRDSASVVVRDDNTKLAELGYRSEFRRNFSVRQKLHLSSSVADRLISSSKAF